MLLIGAVVVSQISSPNPIWILVLAGSMSGASAVRAARMFIERKTPIRWAFLAEAILGSVFVVACGAGILGN